MRHSSFWEWEGKLEPQPGSSIHDAVPEAIEIARKRGESFTFEFNSVTITVHGDSDAALILRDWHRAMSGKISQVGPYPVVTLTPHEQAHDAEVDAQNAKRHAEAQAAWDAKERAKAAAADAKLKDAPAIDLADAAAWQEGLKNNADPYGRGVYTFAERWARLMQLEIAQGHRIADIADRLVSEADIEGITGFMYGCAVSVLAHCWRHGEELRRWHNLTTQIGHEGEKANESGGVLNPALLNLG